MNKKIFDVNSLLTFLLLIVTLSKIFLAGSGMFSFPDEARYNASVVAFQHLLEFNLKGFLEEIFATHGRPGDVIFRLPSVFLQFLCASVFKFNFYGLANTIPVFIVNYLIHLGILLVHYKFSGLILTSKTYALLSTLLFAVLINSFVYLRHCLPYDGSLLFLYFALYLFIKCIHREQISGLNLFTIGTFAIAGYLVYPGYVLFLVALALTTGILLLKKFTFFRAAKLVTLFIFPMLIAIAIVEILSQTVSQSYLLTSLKLSKTILQGSFDESFSFIVKYLMLVESWIGILLLLGLAISLFISVFFKNPLKLLFSAQVIFITFSFAFLAYAVSGFFFHKTVFYGRLLHQFIPLVCVFSVAPLALISESLHKRLIPPFLALLLTFTFALNLIEYSGYAYPRDIHYRFRDKEVKRQYAEISEYKVENVIATQYPKQIGKVDFPNFEKNKDRYLFINCYWYYPFTDTMRVPLDLKEYSEIFAKPHFMNFKAYQFEGYSTQERVNMDSCKIKIRVYE